MTDGTGSGDKNGDKAVAKGSYDSKSKSLQTSYILLIGLSLFFLFMILFPFVSLKYSIKEQQSDSFEGNLSDIFSLSSKYSNISDTLVQKIINAKIKVQNYYEKLDQYFVNIETTESLSNTSNISNPSNVQFPSPLFNKCSSNVLGSKQWGDCNALLMAPDIAADARLVLIGLHEDLDKAVDHSRSITPKLDAAINNILQDRIPIPAGFSQSFLNNTKSHIQQLQTQLSNLQTNLDHFSNYLSAREENLWQFIKDPIGYRVIGSNFNTDWLQVHITSVAQTQEKINKEFESLGSRLEQIEAPIIGRVSFNLRNAISTFPIIVAIGFSACSILLVQVIRSRRIFSEIHGKPFKKELYPLWVDPLDPKLKYIKLFIFALGPIMVFAVAAVLDFSVADQTDNFPLFPFSASFNKIILIISVIIGIVLFIFGIFYIFNEIRNVSGSTPHVPTSSTPHVPTSSTPHVPTSSTPHVPTSPPHTGPSSSIQFRNF